MGLFDSFRDSEKMQAKRERLALERDAEETRRRGEREAERIRQEEIRARSEWDYREDADEMRGTTTSFAQLTSDNSVDLLFPYNGGTRLLITVRISNRIKEVLLITGNGQFDMSLDGYVFSTKFDAGPVHQWTASAADDGSTNVMFVNNASDFCRSLSKAERLIIETHFYSNGRHQFKFNTAALDRRFAG